MKQSPRYPLLLAIIGIIALAIVCVPMAWGQAANQEKEQEIVCPDGSRRNVNYDVIAPDFPKELLPILYCTKMFTGLVRSKICDECYVGTSTFSGTPYDAKGWTWVLAKDKYVSVIEYDAKAKRHEIIWMSETIPKKMRKAIQKVVYNVNELSVKSESF